jgi:metallo-beta-lactamase class B
MAELKRLTGAKMLMQEADAGMLEDGGNSDYRFPNGRGSTYEPVKVDQRLKDGDKVKLGGTELTVMHHPGHTKGATSFSFTTQDAGRTYRVLIANMGSINPGVKVSGMPAFPGITDAYAQTFAKQKQIVPEVWVASHAKQFNLHEKYKPGDAYDANRFVDPEGFRAAVLKLEKIYLDQLAQERQDKK